MKLNKSVFNVLFENARSFAERKEIESVLEDENVQNHVAASLITKLYTSAVTKGHVDFEDLPGTRGDFSQYKGYGQLNESLSLLSDISSAQGIKIPEILVVQTAIENITSRKALYEKAFAMDNEVGMLSYLTLSYATVAATSSLISSYVDFIKSPDHLEFKLLRGGRENGAILIKNLQLFNESVRKGEYDRTIAKTPSIEDRQNLTGSALIFPAVIVMGLMTIIPLSRELVFSFYYSRMKLSDYLAHQSALLELNSAAIQSSGKTQKEKKDIIRKQAKAAHTFASLSEKIKVQTVQGERKATNELKSERKTWTLNEVKPNPMDGMVDAADTSSEPAFKLL